MANENKNNYPDVAEPIGFYRAMRDSIQIQYPTRVHEEPGANLCERGERGKVFRCVTSSLQEGILVLGNEKLCFIITETSYGGSTVIQMTIKTHDFQRNTPFDKVLLEPYSFVETITANNMLTDPERLYHYLHGIYRSNNHPIQRPVVLKYMYSENTPA